MGDEHRGGATLGGDRLADPINDVRINVRQVPQHDHGRIFPGEAVALARQEFVRTVPSEMHDRVGLPLVAQPQVKRQVLVCRPELGVVIR